LVSLLQSGIDDAVEKIAEIDKLAKESVALCNLSITFVIPTLRKNLRNSNLSADLKASLSLKLDTSASKFTSALSKFQASLDSLSVANQKVDAAKKALAALGQLLSACPVDQDAVKAALSEFNKVMADLNAAIKQANVDIVAGDLDAEVGVKLQEDVDSEIPK
jgi:hypothetical protein